MANRKIILNSNYVPKAFNQKFDVLLDEAFRFCIPFSWLDVIRVHFNDDYLKLVLMPDLYTDAINVYIKSFYEKEIMPILDDMDETSKDGSDTKMYIMSNIDYQDIDNYGRIKANIDLLNSAKIDLRENPQIGKKARQITLVGRGRYFSIISKEYSEELFKIKAQELKQIAGKYFKEIRNKRLNNQNAQITSIPNSETNDKQ